MATQATQLSHQPARRTVSWPWFREFMRWELAPYPGRMSAVARMTIATTLVMIIIVTFRIPGAGFLAALFSILLARENLAATWRGGRMIVVAFIVASLYTLLGMMLFRGYPIAHFFWVIGSLYLVFFVIRTMPNYAAAAAFAVPIGVSLPVWDRPLPSELQVEGTLWPVLIIAIGVGATVLIEAIYRIFDQSDPLISFVDDLLLAVQQVLESAANEQASPRSTRARILQYQMIGTGRLRTTLQRQDLDPTRRAQRAAIILLADRLVGLAASMVPFPPQLDADDVLRLRGVSERLGAVRGRLHTSDPISTAPPALEWQPSSSLPMLQEFERIVALLTEVIQRNEVVDGAEQVPRQAWWRTLFLPDAFQNPEYLRFALAGCLAASLCYVLYNALDWPGINTGVLTCIVTALSTVGSSLQAQFLRLAGFVAGGLVLGISAQILVLPAIDGIFGFALFFAAATAIAAWFATSSPRLSYFGVQMALAFYFVNLQDFQIQTDLTIARDKVIGVLLGILAMGFIFDRFGAKSDAEQLSKLLVRNVRMLAELAVCPMAREKGGAVSLLSRLRIQINDNFAALTSQIDSAQFESEFRHRREEDLAECEQIQRAQPALRSIYLLELSLLSHRGRPEAVSELNQHQNQALDHFLSEYSGELLHIAGSIGQQEKVAAPAGVRDDSARSLQQRLEEHSSPNALAVADICQKMVSSLLLLQNAVLVRVGRTSS
jgi:multidrug resistance protein MdtO